MAITFPSSPSPGDIFTSNGKSWQYVNGKWESYGETVAPDVFAVNAASDVVNVYGSLVTGASVSVGGHIIPDTDVTYDLGSSSNRFRDLYLSGSSIDLGGVSITSDGTNLALPPISSVSGDFTVDTDTLHVDSTNNRVGIGTTTPVGMLHVAGSEPRIWLTDTDTNADSYVSASSSVGSLILSADENNEVSGSQIALKVDGSDKMNIQSTGRVGIGTTSPTSPLNVVHTNLTAEPYSAIVVRNTSSTGTAYTGFTADSVAQSHYRYALNGTLKWQTRVGAGTGTDDFRIYSWTAGTDVMIADAGGRVRTPVQTSWRVGLSSSTAYSAGNNTILWNQTSGNDCHITNCTLASGRITVPATGTYAVALHLRTESTPGGNATEVYLRKNGVTVTRWYQFSNTVTNYQHYGPLITTVNASANDYFDVVYAPGNSSSTLSSASNTVCHFSGYLLG